MGAILFAGLLFVAASSFSNGYVSLNLKEMAKRFRPSLLKFVTISGISFLFSGIGLIWGLFKGYTKPWPKRLLTCGLVILNVGIFLTRSEGYLIPGIKYLNYINLIFVAVVVVSQFRKDRVIELVLRILAVVSCGIIGLSSLGFHRAEIANAENITSKNQVYVSGVYTNIRQKASSKSTKLGEVYQGMIFDIVEKEKAGDDIWYKIHTNNGIEGYINEEYASETFDILITDDYINVREKPGTSYDIVGKVYVNEKYIAVVADKMGNRTWYRITLKDGTDGYIGASGIERLN